jgi:hypothetical protein
MPTAGSGGRSVVSGGWGRAWGCAGELAVRKVHLGARGAGSGGSIRACYTDGKINPAQPSAAPKQARRSARYHVRRTEVTTPNVRGLGTFAIKQAVFQHREAGRRHRGRGEGFSRFVRSPIERCAKRHTVLLRGLCAFSLLLCVEKLACLRLIGPAAVPAPSCRPPGQAPEDRLRPVSTTCLAAPSQVVDTGIHRHDGVGIRHDGVSTQILGRLS